MDSKELDDPKSKEVAEKAIEAMKVEEPKTFTFTLKKNVDAKKAEQVKEKFEKLLVEMQKFYDM